MNPTSKKLIVLVSFAIAMAFLETAVVVYLRALYYPGGFTFPLRNLPPTIAVTELLREAATVVMLVAIGFLSGKTKLQRFAYFCWSFAIWDLFYYVFLYLLLAWPQSVFTWDILFLIPLPWFGPVWAPCLVSILMLFGAGYIIYQTEKNHTPRINKTDWLLLIAGACVTIYSFMHDFISTLPLAAHLSNKTDVLQHAASYVPLHFELAIFFVGFSAMCLPVLKHFIYKPLITTSNEIN